jgi:hypothetical protein
MVSRRSTQIEGSYLGNVAEFQWRWIVGSVDGFRIEIKYLYFSVQWNGKWAKRRGGAYGKCF